MTSPAWIGFSIDRSLSEPVFEQICSAIRSKVVAGSISAGETVPPTRVFATELGVSRSTVVTAYEQLVAEGYLTSQQGSGYRVCALGSVEMVRKERQPSTAPAAKSIPQLRPFSAGSPDMRLFPYAQWAKTVSRLCRKDPQAMLGGGGRQGHADLRRAIAAHVSEWRGIEAHPDQIIVTAGASDGVMLCLQALMQRGDTIGLENPGYAPLLHMAELLGHTPQWLQMDAQGAVLPQGKGPRTVVLTPSHQYPLGGAMSPQRRLDFIRWADENDGWILEDDYDSEFRYAGRPIPAMAGFDQLNRTIYIGSFSKIFSNTLRMGYVVAPQALVPRLMQALRRYGSNASAMPQPALAEFIHAGEFYRHLRRVRRVYDVRRQFLLDWLAKHCAEFGHCIDHQAGMQVVFLLRAGLSDQVIQRKALARGVDVEALSLAYAGGTPARQGLIMGSCADTEDEMLPALEIIADILRDIRP